MSVNRIEAEHFHHVGATLGEGPVWDARRQVLWFVDIANATIHRLNPDTCERTSWKAPDLVGWVAPGEGDDLVVGLAKGLYCFSPADGSFALLHDVEADGRDTRINDGTRGPDGTYWFGTKAEADDAPGGEYYRFDGHHVSPAGLPSVRITNGPAVSADGRTLYAVDTLERTIHAHAIAADGSLGQGTVFATIDADHGYPDGVSCDSEGGVWVGIWNGWSARRYDAAGVMTDEVAFPVANVTKIALGGPDGMTAYATTAREGGTGDMSGHQPLGGDLFRFRVKVPG